MTLKQALGSDDFDSILDNLTDPGIFMDDGPWDETWDDRLIDAGDEEDSDDDDI